MAGWSEARIHAWLARAARPVALDGSAGHDAAVLRRLGGRPVWCTDQVHEGLHLEARDVRRHLGSKAVGRTLSDLAASAARPVGVLLALALPRAWTDAEVRRAIGSARRRAEADGAELLGGDLSVTDGPASACVCALGVLEGRRRAPGRDRARAGQVVVVTGPLGGSLRGRHRTPPARLAAGRVLWEAGATALMDVSDGLLLDAERIARASGVRIDLNAERVPVHRDARWMAGRSGRDPLEHALTDGEDHELLACLPARAWRALAGQLPDCPDACVIGAVEEGRGLRLSDDGGRRLPLPDRRGWTHGSSLDADG